MLQEIIDVLEPYTDFPPEQINEDTSLIEDLELNSFDVLTIVSDVEDQYGVHIPDEQIMEFRTVGDIEEYLENNRE
ncbi:MAG: acyl carrier protein [Lachnospiraceae bacterium]|nr:acyl carrier protein [Lachnospiraceae bacterium]